MYKKLQDILRQYKNLGSLKEELEIKVNALNTNIKNIEKQNENYNQKIKKVKEARKDLKVYTTMFLSFVIATSIIMFRNYSFTNLMYVLGVTAIYFGVISSDLKTVITNNIKQISHIYYQNINTLNTLKEKERKLAKELRKCKINKNSHEQLLEKIILDVARTLDHESINEIAREMNVVPEVPFSEQMDEIPVIPEVSISEQMNDIPVIPEVSISDDIFESNQKKLKR